MPPAALAIQYCSQTDIEALLSTEGMELRLDDDQDSAVSGDELKRLTVYAINWATARVNMYCLGLYDAVDLNTNWMVNFYATVLASRIVAGRRCNPVPESLMKLVDETIADLKEIKSQRVYFNDIGLRNVAWPAWSNLRCDPRYWLRQLRVERPLSEKTPIKGYTQNPDRIADLTIEF